MRSSVRTTSDSDGRERSGRPQVCPSSDPGVPVRWPTVLVLALDTATSAVVAGVAELTADGVVVRAQRVAQEARRHGELLVPSLLEACAEAGVALRDAGAVVVGVGPGPFTGLRVGMVTAAALGDALDVPVHGVGTLDAIAHGEDIAIEVFTDLGPRLARVDVCAIREVGRGVGRFHRGFFRSTAIAFV